MILQQLTWPQRKLQKSVSPHLVHTDAAGVLDLCEQLRPDSDEHTHCALSFAVLSFL